MSEENTYIPDPDPENAYSPEGDNPEGEEVEGSEDDGETGDD